MSQSKEKLLLEDVYVIKSNSLKTITITLLTLLVLGGCTSKPFAYAQIYPNPLFSIDEKLSYAVRINDLASVERYLSKGGNPNSFEIMCFSPVDSMCMPPMLASFYHQDYSLINALIESGGNVNVYYPSTREGSADTTPLAYATLDNNHQVAQMLMNYKANPDVLLPSEDTLLVAALFNQNPKMLEILLQAGVDPNKKNTHGANALTLSVREDNVRLSKLLIQYGAKPDEYFWSEVRNNNSSTDFIKQMYQSINGKDLKGSLYLGDSVDIYNSNAIVIHVDGTRYEGLIKEGKPSGEGTLYLPNGNLYKGFFREGVFISGSLKASGKDKIISSEYSESLIVQSKQKIKNNDDEILLTLLLAPLYVVGKTLSLIDWSQVARDLPQEYRQKKQEQERLNRAVRNAVRTARTNAVNVSRARCNASTLPC